MAQQATEKALKAALIFANQPFDPTHDVDVLAALLPKGWHTREVAGKLAHLTSYAVETRYPDPRRQPSAADAVKAAQDARTVYRAVLRDLQNQGLVLRARPAQTQASEPADREGPAPPAEQ